MDVGTLEQKIDREGPQRDWDTFAIRSIANDDVFHIVQYHAYLLSGVFKISFLTNNSTSGNSNKNARRVYVCATGKYLSSYGNQDCSWKITLKRRHGTMFWYMHEVTLGKCTCLPPSDGIDLLPLINLPEFHAQVRKI